MFLQLNEYAIPQGEERARIRREFSYPTDVEYIVLDTEEFDLQVWPIWPR